MKSFVPSFSPWLRQGSSATNDSALLTGKPTPRRSQGLQWIVAHRYGRACCIAFATHCPCRRPPQHPLAQHRGHEPQPRLLRRRARSHAAHRRTRRRRNALQKRLRPLPRLRHLPQLDHHRRLLRRARHASHAEQGKNPRGDSLLPRVPPRAPATTARTTKSRITTSRRPPARGTSRAIKPPGRIAPTKETPFFAVFNFTGTHESSIRGDEPKYSQTIAEAHARPTSRSGQAKAAAVLPRYAESSRTTGLATTTSSRRSICGSPSASPNSTRPASPTTRSSSSGATTAPASRGTSAGSTTPACTCR